MKPFIAALLLVLLFAAPAHAEPYRIISWDDRGVTVEFKCPEPVLTRLGGEGDPAVHDVRIPGFIPTEIEGMPVLPARRFVFAVPSPTGVRLDVLERDVEFIAGIVPRLFSAEKIPFERQREMVRSSVRDDGTEFIQLSEVGTYRRTHLAMVDFRPLIVDRSGEGLHRVRRIVVRLSFPRAPGAETPSRPDRSIARLLVNGDQAAGWPPDTSRRRLTQRTPFEFSRSASWVKIRVSKTGLYLITYNDLLVAGVNPNNIVPTTMRLFSASPFQQPDSIGNGGSFEDAYHLTEHAITYRGSASWEGDSILFYGVGAEGWKNCIDPAADPTERYEHLYETENTYWLTWGGNFPESPVRMESRSVAPAAGAPDINVSTYEERIHAERDTQYDPIYSEDRWYWVRMNVDGSTSYSNGFSCTDLPPGEEHGTGRIVTIGYGPYVPPYINSARYYVNGSILDTLTWTVTFGSFRPKTLDMPLTNLVEGKNTFTVQKDIDDAAYVLWYDILYRRNLTAQSGMLDFSAPPSAGTARFTMNGFVSGDRVLLDVTNYENPVILTGWRPSGGTIEFEDDLDGSPRHYAAYAVSSLRDPDLEIAGTSLSRLPSLRDDTESPHMLIIYHPRFRSAALALEAHRSMRLPYADQPDVKSVDIEHVYDNFSCGLKDPLAIRNYIKFLYDNFSEGGEPKLRYVLLVGNGTHDPKDVMRAGTDLVPFYMNIEYHYYNEAIEDDDFLVKMDAGVDYYADLAIGRLTVITAQEANNWVDRIIDYETNVEPGTWKNKVILVADDEYSSTPNLDFSFLYDAESMSSRNGVFPRFVDFKKIYLHIYPFVGGAKPGARRDLIEEWSKGALIVNYAGHGSDLQMADELVMVKSDVFSLTNGDLRPLYLAFSCHVGDLENPTKRSLAQQLVAFEEGGAIASISGTTYTSGIANTALNYAFFNQLFTSRDSTGTEPLGVAFHLSKIVDFNRSNWRNNALYVLLGDPAFTLALPRYTVTHDVTAIDTMYTGIRYRVDGSVDANGGVMTLFNGTAEIVVQEAEERVDKYVTHKIQRVDTVITDSIHVRYSLPGNAIYRGTADVTAGRFSCDFVVPLRCRTGPFARIRSYVDAPGIDGVGACDTLRIIPSSSVPENEAPPSIRMYFAGQATKVKQGAKLIAELYDKDGIAMLGADPQSSIYLEFDRSGYPIFVTEYFEYDHGSSTSGTVEYPLHAGFSPGPHTVVLRAFDNLGGSASDTLRFEVVEEGIYTVSDVFNMPNPFSESTNFVFQTSSRADVRLCVYNLSGILMWERRMTADEGFNSIYWDGRDRAGDRIANGTYLYILDVEFLDSYHRSETIKGKVVILR
ncbi:MAG TPA: type IX secretion system sortase PorU [Patescibacteria group bacterium]|nr:type IX secretion system sortase PorU [Patescibacteria group bacterium]